MVFDKQTAPKELINSPHYHSYSSAAFPTILLFSISSLTSFCLSLSLSLSHSTSFLCLTRLSSVCLFHPSPPPISKSRYKFFPSVTPPLSLLIFKFFLSLPFFPSTSHPRSLLFGQLSPACLSSNMTSVSFSPEKRSRGRRYQREY